MQVRRYWESIIAEHAHPRGTVKLRVWGGSDVSEADALVRARERASAINWDAFHRPRSRVRNEYAYSNRPMPEPLLDEFIDDDGHRVGAITMNRMGVRVLNTARLAFIDIDTDPGCAGSDAAVAIVAPRSGRQPGLLGRILDVFRSIRAPNHAEITLAVLERLEGWVSGEDTRGARAYETAGGLRLLLTRPHIEPSADSTAELFASMGADPAYTHLCRVQHSFRARLMPKPWRVGEGLLPDRVAYSDLHARPAWLVEALGLYEQSAARFATCRLLEAFGSREPIDGTTALMIELHDDETRAESGLALA
jgi:hypothetical protein